MKGTQRVYDAGQGIWLGNITRALLTSGGLDRYIREFSVTGLTSNPTIHAIKNSSDYDAAIREKTAAGKSGEELFFELAIEDLVQAADLFRPVHEATNRVDGWMSLEASPKLAENTAGTLAQAKALHAKARRPNFFIKIPGTKAGTLKRCSKSSVEQAWISTSSRPDLSARGPKHSSSRGKIYSVASRRRAPGSGRPANDRKREGQRSPWSFRAIP